MKSFTAISALLLLVSSVSAQTRCDPVASAIPTCGVCPLPPPSSIHTSAILLFSVLISTLSDQTPRFPASSPPPQVQVAEPATTPAAARTRTRSRMLHWDVWWATVAFLLRYRCRPVPVRCVLALLELLGFEEGIEGVQLSMWRCI